MLNEYGYYETPNEKIRCIGENKIQKIHTYNERGFCSNWGLKSDVE
jgi:hypothetical protein